MHQDAFVEYAARYLLIPGQCSTAQEILSAIGIERPLPTLISDLIELNDHLAHKNLVITESDQLLLQWNPFTGMTPIISEYAFGVGAFDDHRWLQSMHGASVKVLYDLIHECVHSIWAAFGLCGGLKLLPVHQHHLFHALAEACAVYIGDIEGHETLIESRFFQDFWPSGAHRSHAISFSALKGLQASGLSRDQRAEWLMSIYLDGERSLPYLPKENGLRVEALAFLIEESNYSEKIDLYTTPQWMRHYWGRDDINNFINDFIPTDPMMLASGKTIKCFADLRQSWREVLRGEFWFYHKNPSQLRSQLYIQRKALKVSELLSVFKSHRLQLTQRIKEQALTLLNNTRDQLLERFQKLSSQIESKSDMSGTEIKAEIEALSQTLSQRLEELCGSTLVLTHPYLDAIPFADACPQLKNNLDEARDLGELLRCFTIVSNESLSAFKQLKDNPQAQDLTSQCEQIYLEAQHWMAKLNLIHDANTCIKAQEWLNQLISNRSLILVYPLIWQTAAPFIEPLIGFRYR